MDDELDGLRWKIRQITTLHVKPFLSYIDLRRRILVSGVSPENAIINREPDNSHREQSKVADHVRASK